MLAVFLIGIPTVGKSEQRLQNSTRIPIKIPVLVFCPINEWVLRNTKIKSNSNSNLLTYLCLYQKKKNVKSELENWLLDPHKHKITKNHSFYSIPLLFFIDCRTFALLTLHALVTTSLSKINPSFCRLGIVSH